MKKILLTGQFTDRFREINKGLIGKYEVRSCVNKVEIFKGMFKLNEPDIVVVILDELDKTNEALLKELKKEHKELPVVYSVTGLGKDEIPDYLMSKQFEYLEVPYTVKKLTETIEYALQKDLSKEENSEESKKEKNEDKKEDKKEKAADTEDSKIVMENIIQREKKRKSILLVDDSGIYLRMVKGILEETYDISMATSGLKAIPLIHEKHPDLILLDYEMPLFDGRETMIKIRESEDIKDIPIVFVTAVNDKEHIKAVLSLKPAAYLLKPLDRDRLWKTIKDIIGE